MRVVEGHACQRVNDMGIIRVAGRIKHALLPGDAKHPIVLPKRSDLTNLIIRDEHRFSAHMGPTHVLAQLRINGFWIVGGLTTVKRALSNCWICKRNNVRPLTQQMADLPAERLTNRYP